VTRHRSIPVLFAALALVAAALLSACGATSGTAVSVNGIDLSNQDFNSWLSSIHSNAKLGGTQTTGASPGSYSTTFTTGVLNTQVKYAIIQSELERRHITLSASDLSTAETTVQENLSATTDPSTGQATPGTAAEGKPLLDALASTMRTALIRSQAGQTALLEDYAKQRGTTAALQKLYDANPDQFTGKACVLAIEVAAGSGGTDASGNPVTPSDSDFATALGQINQVRSDITGAQAGDLQTEFASAAATIASQEGLQSDGDLGCQSKGTYTTTAPALEDAIWNGPVGEVSQPIKVAEGYLLAFVSARGDLTFAQAKPELQKAAATKAQSDYTTWLAAAARKADVTVDPQWGTWDRKTGTVVAPAGASSSTTSTVKAKAPAAGSPLNLGGSTTTTAP
jgi:hypothetical protein